MKNKIPVPNPAYDTTCTILRAAGYNRLDEFKRQQLRGYLCPKDRFEVWGGPKGVVFLQVWKDGNGVNAMANWPLGHTFDELKAALGEPFNPSEQPVVADVSSQ